MVKLEGPMQCKYLLYWSGERGLQLFNSWDLFEDEQKVLQNYFDGFENFVTSHANKLIAAWQLYNIKQATLTLEEFIAQLRLLIKEANYPAAHHKQFLQDFLFIWNEFLACQERMLERRQLTHNSES